MKTLRLFIPFILFLFFSNTVCHGQVVGVSPNPQAITLCDGDVTTINFTPNGSCVGNYEYQVLDGVTVVQAWSTISSYNTNNTLSTTYTVELRCSSTPATIVSDTFFVNIINPPTVSGNLTVCSGDSTVLTASGGSDLEWWDSQTGGTQVSATDTFTTPNLTNSTTYWTQSSGIAAGGGGKILITECGLEGYSGNSSADYLEISNLYGTPVNTTGWVAAVSNSYSNINSVNTILWNLPSSFNACSVVSRNDVSGDPNYWGSNILWNPGANTTYRSWAIIIDDLGNVVDFAVWGWTAADIATFSTTINGFPITLGPEWVGNGCDATCGVAGGPQLSIQRVGNNDNNDLNDFVCQASTVDVVNPGLVCGWSPFSCRFPVTVNVEPISTVAVPSNATYCAGDIIPASTFSSNPIGGTFTWTNSNPSIGLAASGTGNTPTFNAINGTAASVTATITVTPTVNGCQGTPSSYTITIDPCAGLTANFNASTNTLCLNDCISFTDLSSGSPTGWTWSFPGGTPNSSTNQNPTNICYNTSGSYDAELIVTNGIISDTLLMPNFITVNPTPTVTVPPNAVYCAGDAVPASVFTSIPSGGSFTWTNSDPSIGLAASGNANTPAFTATNGTASPITATITVTPTVGGCTGSPSSYTITVDPCLGVTSNFNSSSTVLCQNDCINFTDISSGSPTGWIWSFSGGTPNSSTTQNPTNICYNTAGSHDVQLIVTNGSVNDTLLMSNFITVNPTPTVTVPPNAVYCAGDIVSTTIFTSNPSGGSFTWTNSDPSIGLAASGNGNTPTFTAVNGTTSPITATITVTPTANGCLGTPSNYTITVNPKAVASVPSDFNICNGENVNPSTFSSIPIGGSFTWSNSNTSIGLTASGNGNTPAFTASNLGNTPIIATISVTATVNGCSGPPSSYIITVNPTPFVSSNISICQGDSILIAGNYYNSAGNYTDTLATSFGCDSVVTYNLTINPVPITSANYTICLGDSIQIEGDWYTSAGIYPYTYTSAAGCDSIVNYDVVIDSIPLINIYAADSTIDLGFSTLLTAYTGVGNTSYEWTPTVGLDCIFCQYPNASPPESMWYYVTATNDNGCSRTDSLWIEVDPSTNIYVPNIFSPNGDGQNDLYKVRGKGIRQFNLYIYNRWGQLVFESTNINNGWDGTKNGKILNQGVFVYKLNVTMYTGEEYKQTGNITLVR